MKVSVATALSSVDDGGDFVVWASGDLESVDVRGIVDQVVAHSGEIDPNVWRVSRYSDRLVEVYADFKGDGVQATALVSGLRAALQDLKGAGRVRLAATQPGVDLLSEQSGPMFGRPVMRLVVSPTVPHRTNPEIYEYVLDGKVRHDMRGASDEEHRRFQEMGGLRRIARGFTGPRIEPGTGVQPEVARSAADFICEGAEWAAVGAGAQFVEIPVSDAPARFVQRLADDDGGPQDLVVRCSDDVLTVGASTSELVMATTYGPDPAPDVARLADWVLRLDPAPRTAVLVPGQEIWNAAILRRTSIGEQWNGNLVGSDAAVAEIGWFNLVTPELAADPDFIDAVDALGEVARRDGRVLWVGTVDDWLPDPLTFAEEAPSGPPPPPSELAANARTVLAPFLARR